MQFKLQRTNHSKLKILIANWKTFYANLIKPIVSLFFRRSIQTSATINANVGLSRIQRQSFFKRIDKIDENSELIYKLPFHYTLNVIKSTCLTVSGIVPVAWLHSKLFMDGSMDELESFCTLAMDSSDLYVFLFGMYFHCIALLYIIHKLPMRIYSKDDKLAKFTQIFLLFRF